MLLPLLMNNLLESGATTATVPDVVGDAQAAGTTEIEAEGFVVAVELAYSSSVAAGVIISQSPTGGSTAVVGSTVTITVSLGDSPQEANYSGGWSFLTTFEQQLEARKRRKKEMEEAESKTQALPPVEKEIASLLHKQERIDESRKDIDRLRALVSHHSQLPDVSSQVQEAFAKAKARQTVSSLLKLDKALKRALEEEELAVLMLLIND